MFVKSILNTDADRRRTVQNLPVGTVMLWHGSTAPAGWEICDGRALPIGSYGALYSVITAQGTVFPFGPNTTVVVNGVNVAAFVLPDIRDRHIMSPTASANSPGSGYVGSTGGSASHAHSATPLVSAVVNDNAHPHSYTMGSLIDAGGHSHSGGPIGSNTSTPLSIYNRAQNGSTAIAIESHSHSLNFDSNNNGSHAHTVGGPANTNSNNHAHSITTTANSTQTANASHEPPAMRANHIVYAGTVA